jgi:hypothetical protein
MPELPTCILIDPAITSLDEIAVDTDGHSITLRMSTCGAGMRAVTMQASCCVNFKLKGLRVDLRSCERMSPHCVS